MFGIALTGAWAGAAGQEGTDGQTGGHGESRFDELLHEGFALHQQARFTEAIPILEQARRLAPGDYFANLLLGIDLLRMGRAEAALPRLEAAATARPGEEIPEEYLGEAQAGLGHNGAAATAYQRAVSLSKGDEDALLAWAGFALERFRQIEERLRDTPEGVAVARRIEAAAAGPEKAGAQGCAAGIAGLERRLTGAGLDGDAAYRLATCYARLAGQAATQMAANAKDTSAVERLHGEILMRLSEDYPGAIGEFQKALALHPGDPALLERLAEAQYSGGDPEGARRSAEAALAIDPHRRSALRTEAAIAMETRDYEGAIPTLRKLVTEEPGNRKPQVELGRALAQTGHDADAAALLEPALEGGYVDEKGALHALLARVLLRLNRPEEAAKAEAEARRLSDAFQEKNRSANEAPK